MRLVYPGIDPEIDTECERVNCIVIENKAFYCELLGDICGQINGDKGKAVLSDGMKIYDFSKKSELITSFFPFELNSKNLVSKISSALEKRSMSPEFFEKTSELVAEIERYLDALASDFPCDLVYGKLSISSVIKAAGPEAADDSTTLAERLLNYLELTREFDTSRLFITVNFRSFVGDEETERFIDSVIKHKFDLIMLENAVYPRLKNERRIVIDGDLCCIY